MIRMLGCRCLDPRPLGPQVYSRRRYDHIGNICPADSSRRLEKIEAPVLAPLDELRVRHAADETERAQKLAIERFERLRV